MAKKHVTIHTSTSSRLTEAELMEVLAQEQVDFTPFALCNKDYLPGIEQAVDQNQLMGPFSAVCPRLTPGICFLQGPVTSAKVGYAGC